MVWNLLAAILIQVAAPAANDTTCPAGASAIPTGPYAGWGAMQGVTAGTSAATPSTLAMGRSARATLAPVASVKFPVELGKAPAAGSNGGLFAFDVTSAGTYRVALGAAAWVDVVAGDKVVPSTAHAHGPDCSGIRKIVDFRLTPGRYLIQASGAKADTLVVMVAKVD